jgi:hypothetical protein
MSTRGAVSFVKNNKFTTIYNSGSSVPSVLGNDILDFIRRYPIEEINELVDSFIYNDKENEETASFYSLRDFWSNGKKKTLVYDDTQFLRDSLLCEWAYIINLDTNELEIYEGMNKEEAIGRFEGSPKNAEGYYPVSLVEIIPFEDLPPELQKFF